MNSLNNLIQAFLLVILFFLSGFDKINNVSKLADGLKNKVNLNINIDLYKLAIIIVILLEIFAPIIIMYSVGYKKYYKYSYYSTIGLILFTILATFLYHFPATGKNYYSFMNHVALVGGLMLLAEKFKNNI